MPDTAVIPSHAAPRIGQSLTIAALGVVYGDIGTSPLYAIRQCLLNAEGVTAPRVFGVLSLIAWALTLVVTVKYVIVLMRADNRGEGGIVALTVLALRAAGPRSSRWILSAGLLGLAATAAREAIRSLASASFSSRDAASAVRLPQMLPADPLSACAPARRA